jgi:hypothetical protein
MDNLPTILTEIDTIEHTMRATPSAYFKNEPMQARYRNLLVQKGGAATVLDDASSEPLVPILSPKAYAADTGTAAGFERYLEVSRTAADWVFALPAGEQRKFVASIEALPDDVGAAMIAEILERVPSVVPSSDKAVAAFGELPEGAVLSREWGALTARNLARVRERLFRVEDKLEDRHISAFEAWLNGLSTDCAICLYRKLAA